MSTNPFNPWALTGPGPRGPVSAMPWMAWANIGVEDYSHGEIVGQSSDRADPINPWIAVTCGTLRAAEIGAYMRGRIEPTDDGGAFRALAYGYDDDPPGDGPPVQWTDQTIDYRFNYKLIGLIGVNPGFKAFARYQDEDNLYVASWRFDGVIQIQRKLAGAYSTLIMTRAPAPTLGAWHRLRFSAIGDVLTLTLDGRVAVAIVNGTFAWGTVGIRTDATPGAYLDDWRVE